MISFLRNLVTMPKVPTRLRCVFSLGPSPEEGDGGRLLIGSLASGARRPKEADWLSLDR